MNPTATGSSVRSKTSFRQWLDAVREESPEQQETTRPTVTCAICSPSSPRCRRRPGCRIGSGPGRAGNRRQRRSATTRPPVRRRVDQTLAAFERRVSRTAEDHCLLEILEVRDALVRGRDAAAPLRESAAPVRGPPRGAGGVVEGYELALGRVGRPFDGRVIACGGCALRRPGSIPLGKGQASGNSVTFRIRSVRPRRARGEFARAVGRSPTASVDPRPGGARHRRVAAA